MLYNHNFLTQARVISSHFLDQSFQSHGIALFPLDHPQKLPHPPQLHLLLLLTDHGLHQIIQQLIDLALLCACAQTDNLPIPLLQLIAPCFQTFRLRLQLRVMRRIRSASTPQHALPFEALQQVALLGCEGARVAGTEVRVSRREHAIQRRQPTVKVKATICFTDDDCSWYVGCLI